MPRPTTPLIVSEDQAKQIEQWLSALGTPQQVALRCRIVLATGESESTTASRLGINRKTVHLWRERFSHEGLDSLWEIAPGRGRKPTYGADRIKAVIDATLQNQAEGNDSLELSANGVEPGTQQVHHQYFVAKP
jgi:transposase-like protein